MNSKLQEAIADGVVADLLREAGASETEVRFALEALSKTGKAKRRELRLLRMYVAAIARIAREPRDGDDLGTVLEFADAAQGMGLDLVQPKWSENRRLARLRNAGHSWHCASRIVNTGECECAVNDPSREGRLRREDTLIGYIRSQGNAMTVEADRGGFVATAGARRYVETEARRVVFTDAAGVVLSIDQATGSALDRHAMVFSLQRNSGETDDDLRARVLRTAWSSWELVVEPKDLPPPCVVCGKPSIRECPTAHQFHCGAPLCASCHHGC